MKFLHILTLLLVTLVAYTAAQRCQGSPGSPRCSGAHDVGHGGRGCRPRSMWYFEPRGRHCIQMMYYGCGGNNNRWCSRSLCLQACSR